MIRDRIVDFRRVPAGQLQAHPRNWRTHPEGQRAALAAVLEDIGYADALLARELEDGRLELVDGHLRADTTPDQDVPVLIVDLSEEEAARLLTVFDPLTNMAEANAEILQGLLAEFQTDSPALQKMLDDLAKQHGANQTQATEDEVPEPPDDPTTQPGDLWILGEHRLLCGDSSLEADVDRLLDGAAIHLVNTDPPYNVKVEPRSNNAIRAGNSSFPEAHGKSVDHERDSTGGHKRGGKRKATGKMRAKDRPLENDFVSDEEFDRLLAAWFGNLARVLLPGRCFYIWGGYANCANYPPHLKASGLYFSQAIIWDKQHPVLTRKDFMGAHEWCFYGWREGAGHEYFGPGNATDLWSIKKVNPQNMVHLTEKPVELAVRAMNYSSRPGEHVIDLFGGSGSTLMGAEQTGRRAFLMELDPAYCDVIVERWEKFTGRKAERVAAQEKAPAETGA